MADVADRELIDRAAEAPPVRILGPGHRVELRELLPSHGRHAEPVR